jgi:hypothetical protein
MASAMEQLELNCLFHYKQLKSPTKQWLYSSIFHSSKNSTAWRLQIDNSHPKNLGIYLTLIDGAPCTLSSYSISMMTNTEPSLEIFKSRCTLQRTFQSNDFSWGFEKLCTRHDLKDERHLICDPKTKLINVRCIMNMEEIDDDHRFATDLFDTRTLEQWIDLLKQRDDLLELTNRVNQEIEARL